MTVKLQHWLSQRGIFSRRHSETMIQRGMVLVNNSIEKNHLRMVTDDDVILLSPLINDYASSLGVILFNKPRGIWSNCKQNGKEIIDLLPSKYKGYSTIGRLDKDSEGLILLTNDGVFANQFLNSDETHIRRYIVWTKPSLNIKDCQRLSNGRLLDDGPTMPCKVTPLQTGGFEFIMTEGRNRQIRRMVASLNSSVTRLKRTQFSRYNLVNLKQGQFKWLSLKSNFLKRNAEYII